MHLVSSYLASLLIGSDAPIDPGDASGANLMDLQEKQWWTDAVRATAPGLADKLPTIAASWTVAGMLSPYWQARVALPPARVIAWSGDNPCSLIGVGLVREGRVAISLGTSDTIFGLMKEPRVDSSGTGHVFSSPTGDYMGLTCFSNGSLARERVRDAFGPYLYKTIIRRTIRFAEAPARGRSIFDHASGTPGADAYRQIARVLHAEAPLARDPLLR